MWKTWLLFHHKPVFGFQNYEYIYITLNKIYICVYIYIYILIPKILKSLWIQYVINIKENRDCKNKAQISNWPQAKWS